MQQVTRILTRLVSKPNDCLFDSVVDEFISYVDRPVHSLQEMRDNRSTKMKGDLFEAFCVLYLQRKGYTVWLLKETPADILDHIGLGTFDVGIDLIARKNGRFSAVQCKFKRPRPGFVKGTWLPYNCVNWKEVSTFFSLCHRTQEKAQWQHHIVMTNCKYVRRMGNATPYDKTFAYGSFSKLSAIETIDMIKNVVEEVKEDVDDEVKEKVKKEVKEKVKKEAKEKVKKEVKNKKDSPKNSKTQQNSLSIEDIRKARLAFFDKI